MIEPEHFFDFGPVTQGPSPGSYTTVWTVRYDLPYFEGHFPGHPVLPAIAVIDASLVALQAAVGEKTGSWKILSGKFTNKLNEHNDIKIVEIDRNKSLRIRVC